MSIRNIINQNKISDLKKWMASTNDINEKFDNDTALFYAVGRGNLEVVKMLIERGADVNIGSPIISATYQCNFEILKLLIANGANVNITFENQNGYKSSLLGYSFEREYSEMSVMFIENGADVNITFERDKKRYSPLSYCLETENFDMAIMLFEHGADINITFEYCNERYTPLRYAIEKGKIESVKILLDLGANIPDGRLLINAIGGENFEVAKTLIAYGAKPSNIYIANSILRKGIQEAIHFDMLQKFQTLASGSSVIYDTSALLDYSFVIGDIFKIKSIGHHIPNEVINELDQLAKSDDKEMSALANKVSKTLFNLPSNTFDIIHAVHIDERHKNEDKKIQEVIEIVHNWDVLTYICSSDDIFKIKVKHLDIEKINFIN